MKSPKTFLLLSVVAAVLILGVAYAAISNVTLEVNGTATATPNNDNFKVAFVAPEVTTDTQTNAIVAYTITDKLAKFTVTGLDSKDETATIKLTIKNSSTDIDATIAGFQISNSNSEYFTVTENVEELFIGAGQSVDVTITVTLAKNVVETESESTTITATFDAVASTAVAGA